MKLMKLTKSIAIFLVILGVCLLTGCHQNQIPVDGVDCDENPEHEECIEKPVDCEKNPEHEECIEEEEYPFSLGFTLYELKDSQGKPLNAYSVGDYTGEDTVVKIPSVFKDKPVIKIKDNTFADDTKITKVIIPDSIEILGKSIFSNCKSLKEVVFEGLGKIQVIPDNTFYKCLSLEKISIPTSVKQIGDLAFYGCSSISELRVPISVVSIGRSAFGAMSSLSTLSVPFIGGGRADSTEVDVLGFVFDNIYTEFTSPISQKVSDKSTKTYFIPNTLKTIEILPGKTTSIGYGALSGVTSVETIIIPSNITKFGDDAFTGATGINRILYSGSENDWQLIIGHYDTGNKEVLDRVEVIYNYQK